MVVPQPLLTSIACWEHRGVALLGDAAVFVAVAAPTCCCRNPAFRIMPTLALHGIDDSIGGRPAEASRQLTATPAAGCGN